MTPTFLQDDLQTEHTGVNGGYLRRNDEHAGTGHTVQFHRNRRCGPLLCGNVSDRSDRDDCLFAVPDLAAVITTGPVPSSGFIINPVAAGSKYGSFIRLFVAFSCSCYRRKKAGQFPDLFLY